MSLNFETYIDRLRKFYGEYGDAISLKRIDDFVKSKDNIAIMAAFKSNPHSEVLLKSAMDRYKTACRKLWNQRTMTQEERNLVFLDMDWAKWYITAVGGNISETEESMEAELESEMKRIGLSK